MNSMDIQVIGVLGLPLIQQGDDLPALICERVAFQDGDILAVASSVYSKSKGFTRDLATITPGADAVRIAEKTKEDPRFVQAVLDSSADILLDTRSSYRSYLPAISACGRVSTTATLKTAGSSFSRPIPWGRLPRSGTLSAASPAKMSGCSSPTPAVGRLGAARPALLSGGQG